jgi:8-oxo-dGTP diphosphatase
MSRPSQPASAASGHLPRHAVVAIVRRGERVLFVRRSQAARGAAGYWTPVSGGVEPGETERQALRREVREEVGLLVEAHAKVATIPTRDGRYLLHFWTCRLLAGEARAASDEVADLRWLTLTELRRLTPVFDEDVRIVAAALARPDPRSE